jgi:hypothetical protein
MQIKFVAVCVYLLTGICFAMIHMMIALSDPEAYRNNVSPTNATTGNATPNQITNSPMSWATRYPLFVYFSFCTFSTVGYGDILPISRLARSVSCLEATIGQLYIAILIARLVGLHTVTASLRYKTETLSMSDERELVVSKKN